MGDNPILFVSAGNYPYFKYFKRMANNLKTFEPNCKFHLWDLGLTEQQVEEFQEEFPWVVIKRFPFENYPDYFRLDVRPKGEYAWKPVIIDLEAQEWDGLMFWMDSPNLVLQSLVWERNHLSKNGIYSPVSSGTLRTWTHPKVLEYLKIPEHFRDSYHMRSAGLVGMDLSKPFVREFTKEWSELAQDINAIAPEGTHRGNHRQDQSIMTYVFYKLFEREKFEDYIHQVSIRYHQFIKELISLH